jgi:DNA-binding XRE family transcriptional regulator
MRDLEHAWLAAQQERERRMGMEAVGAYLRTLRDDGRKISRAKLAAQLEVSEQSIYRIEENRQEPNPELLARIIATLGGDPTDVHELLLHKKATPEQGRDVALQRINVRLTAEQEVDQLVVPSDPEALRQAIAELRIEYEREPAVVELFRSWLAGWRARS